MNSANKKKLNKASILLQEVADFLEERSPEDFDVYGQRLYDLADEIEAIVGEVEENEQGGDEDDDGFHEDDL